VETTTTSDNDNEATTERNRSRHTATAAARPTSHGVTQTLSAGHISNHAPSTAVGPRAPGASVGISVADDVGVKRQTAPRQPQQPSCGAVSLTSRVSVRRPIDDRTVLTTPLETEQFGTGTLDRND